LAHFKPCEQIDTAAIAAPGHQCNAVALPIPASARLLVVENNADPGKALSDELALAGYRCDVALSAPAALSEASLTPFDAIISDLRMDGMTGIDMLETLTRERPLLPVIIMTGFTGGSASEAMDKGAFHYFTKPVDFEELRGVIEQAIGDRKPIDDAHHKDVLLPTGPVARALIARIDRFASAQFPVLIQGESGTGKELVARAIHERGNRANAPFIAVNTAAIPEQLLESELFGHVRGAFSGATQNRRGLLEEAHKGTLLLDEIGDMPLNLQAKLLRVIQFGEVRAIGSDRSRIVDVRFLAATHRDLKAWVHEGKFRSDLYYRLSVLELNVPPLRDRRGEIPALVTHFLTRARSKKLDSPVRVIDPDALRVLTEAPWPGNIRELSSTIDRLVVLGDSSVITTADLELAGVAGATAPAESSLARAQQGAWTLEELSQHYVDWTLAQVAGDKGEAARILGINVSTLYRWLRGRPQA
jgi:two-component system response regulator HydG